MSTTSHSNVRRALIAVLHLGLIAASNYGAFLIRFDGHVGPSYTALCLSQLPWLLLIRGATFLPLKLYESLWRYTGIWDVCAVGIGVFLSTLLFAVELWAGGLAGTYPRSVLVVDALLLGVAVIVVRIAPRAWAELTGTWRGRRVLVIGAGDAGAAIVREMKKTGKYRPIGLVDDDERLQGTRIHGVRVLGGLQEVGRILAETAPEEALLAVPRADPATVRRFVSAFEQFKIPIRTLPYLRESFDGRFGTSEIRNLSVNDLLPRAPVGIDASSDEALPGFIKGRRVLVTGAGGSIGSELCRQIAALEPASLVLFERYENSLFTLVNTLADAGAKSFVHPVVGDVGDQLRVDGVLAEYAPEIIFHAAAHKHVPLMELNPCEAIKNNVRGTRIVAEAAVAHGVERFVLVSSDKAVYPASVMGASKRVAEMLVQDLAARSGTLFLAVRFGNVLGSNGSVVLTFLEQIKAGGPVTVTHPEVRRYFMLIEEAVQLVLHAARENCGGVYVLEMGEPIYLTDLARNAIRLCGFIPEDEIRIKFVGLRPGEKLWEDLVEVDEVVEASHARNVQRVRPPGRPPTIWLTHQNLGAGRAGVERRARAADRRAGAHGADLRAGGARCGPGPRGAGGLVEARASTAARVETSSGRLCQMLRAGHAPVPDPLPHRATAEAHAPIASLPLPVLWLARVGACGGRRA